MDQYLLSVVLPVYNESYILKKSFLRIHSVLSEAEIPFEIIYIDDGSGDNSSEVIKELSEEYPCVKGIVLSRNFGKESAICAGLDIVGGDVCVVMDCDLQHPPEYIPEMVKMWQGGAEVVEGVKNKRQKESFFNKISAGLFYKLLNSMSGIDLKNASDFRLFDRKAIDAWKQMPEKQTFFRAMSTWIGFKREKLYFDVHDRLDDGKSRWRPFKLFKLGINAITSFSAIPLQIVTVIGIIFFVFSVILLIQTLVVKIFGHADAGFPTVIILLLIIGSVIMLSLGIIGIYLAKIYEEVKGRPRYIVSGRIDKNDDKG